MPKTGALVLLTMMRVLAYTLSRVFYHRQVVSPARHTPPTFREMARLLAYLFLPPRRDTREDNRSHPSLGAPPGAFHPTILPPQKTVSSSFPNAPT